MKTTIYVFALMLISLIGQAQQNTQYSQYIFNQLVINPAYAGTKGLVNITGLYSAQWAGLDGAPVTQSLSVEGPFMKTMGLGLHFINDEIGAQRNQSMFGSYSYILRLNQTMRLSMGVSSGVTYSSLNGNLLSEEMQNDPAIPVNKIDFTRFDSKLGFFLFSRKFYAGFSVSELTANVKNSYDMLVAGQVQHYYLTAGYVFNLTPDLKFKPGFLIKEDFRAPMNIDINAFMLYKNRIWFGGTFRTGAPVFNSKSLDESLRTRDAVLLMTEMFISDKLRVGYAFTYSLTSLHGFSGHEVLLAYSFQKKAPTKMLTPRFF
ncbi:MAG: hypothetical protein CVU05_08060 [Bacteroidetes bacterium HGW-Bacteroidetes-21]|jgi:type IX secretion system PorP/SprF family membrane protein|nr:MAG: hypothetical protein CVU05_08060 [Bacteroidetes bacterium HGW-Bacteroidetes-21]